MDEMAASFGYFDLISFGGGGKMGEALVVRSPRRVDVGVDDLFGHRQ